MDRNVTFEAITASSRQTVGASINYIVAEKFLRNNNSDKRT